MPTHPYLLKDGTRVPGVTTVIGRFKEAGGLIHWANTLGLQGIDYRSVRDAAASAGTVAHEMIERKIRGDDPFGVECDDPGTLALAKQGYESFNVWFSASKIEILETEIPLVSETYRFGGCPDAVGLVGVNKVLTLLDWKTSNATYVDHLLQIRAYGALWSEVRDQRFERYNIARFGKDGADFHYHSWSAEQLDPAWGAFKKMRELYDTMKELKRLV